ncbi:hypothetical protein FGU71_13880 [Erythrobacter insulae]|uniref:Transferrin-binding protein-like solute binding protein n=1 Tax=Erythrobacter insulae TaxID=2584124 RepID=A0A547P7F7_9SPHN|nr:hypothetical protein [Erythrobacter insulae]TRD10076.1 hypothetical protein FGU71_13880 [Erythrobacter insulae]
MKRIRNLGAAALALALVACGGGGGSSPPPQTGGGSSGGGSSGGGTPAPSPAPTYTEFASLTGNQTFQSACSGFELGFNFATFPSTSFTNGFGFDFTAATDVWTISPATGFSAFDANLSFGSADLQSSSAEGTASYRRQDANGQTELFRYGFVSSLSPAPAYARSLQLSAILPNGNRGIFRCTFGVTTQLSDPIPTVTASSGFISYGSYSIEGDAYVRASDGTTQQFSLDRSNIDFRANPADGSIRVGIEAIGREFLSTGALSDQETALGTAQGDTSIDGSEQNFSGLMNGTSPDGNFFGGGFGGWFFGPQGAELGMVFEFFINRADGSVVIMSGVVTGTGQDEFVPV